MANTPATTSSTASAYIATSAGEADLGCSTRLFTKFPDCPVGGLVRGEPRFAYAPQVARQVGLEPTTCGFGDRCSARSEERRVGKECVSSCSSRRSQDH